MARIFGKDGYQRLLLGREININDIKTRTCTIAKTDTSSNAVAGVRGGELLVYTDRTQVYAPASKADDKVAGICLGTNVKLDPYFPESADEFRGGKCLTERIECGDLATPIKWQCHAGHEFMASFRSTLARPTASERPSNRPDTQ